MRNEGHINFCKIIPFALKRSWVMPSIEVVLNFAKNVGKCAPKQLSHCVVKTVIESLSNLGLCFLSHLQKVEKQQIKSESIKYSKIE